MTSFSFPDLFNMAYTSNFLGKGNFYSLVKGKKLNCVWLDATYPPLYFFTTGLYLKIVQFLNLLPKNLFKDNCPVWEIILNRQFLFWFKIPNLFFIFLSGWLFSKFFKKDKEKWFWLFITNPVVIFISLIQGQYEIIPTFFLLLAIFFAQKKEKTLSFFFLGIAGAYKNFPFLLIFPFYFFLVKNFWEIIYLTIILISSYLAALIPVFNSDYLSNSLMFSENFKMFDFGINIGGEKISFYLVFYTIIFLMMIKEKVKDSDTFIKYIFLFSLIYFLTSFWFVQRLLFLIPSLILISSKRKNIFDLLPILYVFYFLYALFLYPGLFDHTLLRPLFGNLKPIDYQSLPQISLIKLICYSLIWGLLFWLGYLSQKKEEKNVFLSKSIIFFNFFPLIGYLFFLLINLYISGFFR